MKALFEFRGNSENSVRAFHQTKPRQYSTRTQAMNFTCGSCKIIIQKYGPSAAGCQADDSKVQRLPLETINF